MAHDASLKSPPYVPFGTFKNFVRSLGSKAMPSKIDRSLMQSMSGGSQAGILAALRFLQLTDPDGRPSDDLKALAKSSDLEWPEMFGKTVRRGYSAMLAGELDLTSSTAAQLDDAFRTIFDIKGSTVDKAAMFFIAACKDAGVPLSEHVLSRRTRQASANARKKTTKKSPEPDVVPNAPSPAVEIPEVMSAPVDYRGRLIEKLPQLDPTWPPEVIQSWLASFQIIAEAIDERPKRAPRAESRAMPERATSNNAKKE